MSFFSAALRFDADAAPFSAGRSASICWSRSPHPAACRADTASRPGNSAAPGAAVSFSLYSAKGSDASRKQGKRRLRIRHPCRVPRACMARGGRLRPHIRCKSHLEYSPAIRTNQEHYRSEKTPGLRGFAAGQRGSHRREPRSHFSRRRASGRRQVAVTKKSKTRKSKPRSRADARCARSSGSTIRTIPA